MKRLIILSITVLLLGSTANAQKINPIKEGSIMINCGCSGNAGKKPLYVIDGKVVTNLNEINPDNLKSIIVLKDASSTAKYGLEGANGVIEITTKNAASKSIIENKLKEKTDSIKVIGYGSKIILRGKNTLDKEPLYVLDGKIMEEDSLNALNPNKIQSIEVLKNESAILLYGPEAVNGVLVITTKKDALQKTKPQ